eukprot:TRINITY_DN28722_c0_g1_i1.p2 TRINITY_DN28722_c0_g1~~TRINITY_DN28722_c0_g1_i1.p2  ORF type:complete len:159 (+),score=15.33 TRINITY_DN28722_c0_g1_i1:75-551(+)
MCVCFFFFSSRRRHTRSCLVSWARRCVQETGYINPCSPIFTVNPLSPTDNLQSGYQGIRKGIVVEILLLYGFYMCFLIRAIREKQYFQKTVDQQQNKADEKRQNNPQVQDKFFEYKKLEVSFYNFSFTMQYVLDLQQCISPQPILQLQAIYIYQFLHL